VSEPVVFLDPDTKNSSLCVATETRVLAVGVAVNQTKALEGKHAMKHRIAEQCSQLTALTRLVFREFPTIRLAVAEFPQDRKKRWVNPDDLIALASTLGAFLGPAGDRGVLVWPVEWKGTLSKTNCQKRAFEYFGWDHEVDTRMKDGVRKFRIPESVRCLSEIPTAAMGDVADAVAGAKWAAIFGKRRVGT
jgi:hypothetical protein